MNRKEYERVSPESVGIPSAAIAEMVDELEKVTEMHSIMVMRHGKICAEGWWSPFGPGIPHGLQSLSKTYTATAIGIAYTEGLLSLDEKLVDLFPDHLPEEVSENLKKISIYDVLIMGNGMENNKMGGDWIRNYFASPVIHEPGTEFYYSSLGTSMLGAIIKLKTGVSMTQYLRKKLFDKIGIDHRNKKWIRNSIDGIEVGGGGMLATTEDNLRLMDLYRQGGVWEGERILAEDFVKMATTKQIDTYGKSPNRLEATDHQLGYGFQMWMCQPEGAYRSDGAFGQYGIVFPKHDMIISLTETTRADDDGSQYPLDAIYNTILKHLSDEPLEENTQAERDLKFKLDHLALARPEYKPYSPLIEDINGVKWQIEKGTAYIEPYPVDHLSGKRLTSGIREFTLNFETGRILMDYVEDGEKKSAEIATDGTRTLNVLPNSATPYSKVYLSAYWPEDDLLRIVCRWIESPYEHTLDLKFDDPAITITFSDIATLREPADPTPVIAVRA